MDIVKELHALSGHARDSADWIGEFSVACTKVASEIEDLREQIQDLIRDLDQARSLEAYLRAVIDAKEDVCNDLFNTFDMERKRSESLRKLIKELQLELATCYGEK